MVAVLSTLGRITTYRLISTARQASQNPLEHRLVNATRELELRDENFGKSEGEIERSEKKLI